MINTSKSKIHGVSLYAVLRHFAYNFNTNGNVVKIYSRDSLRFLLNVMAQRNTIEVHSNSVNDTLFIAI